MKVKSAPFKISLFISIFLLLSSIHLSRSEELYLFEEEASLLITNTPSPGYIKIVGRAQKQMAWKPLPGKVQQLESYIESIAGKYSISPSLIKAVIQADSNFNPMAVSPKGAKGLMQLMNSTAADFGVRSIFDPYENITGGARYLRYLLDLFKEDLPLALAAYNADPKANEIAVEFDWLKIEAIK